MRVNDNRPVAICLMGPTACGKTDLAIALSEYFPVEIINVDSAQVYQGLDIGSGKSPFHIRQHLPHHLIDIVDPASSYSVAQFRNQALCCIEEIMGRKKVPLLVGGTMLYFKALQEGLSPLPNADPSVRQYLEQKAQQQGWAALYQQLEKIDPLTASRIKSTDSQRIQRALEIAEITGKPMSHWLLQPKEIPAFSFRFINIALLPFKTPRSVLHQRIALRFDSMLNQGLVQEVEKLLNRGDLSESLPAIRSVGYRQVWHYLQDKISFAQMQEKAIAATRQLAKRQLTWLRPWPELAVFDFHDPSLQVEVIQYLQESAGF